jgi:hypothetical protein
MKSNPVYHYDDINFDNIRISELDTSGRQITAQISYFDEKNQLETPIYIQTDTMKIAGDGIPKYHDIYYPTDDKREFILIYLDLDQLMRVKLRNHLEKMDMYFGSKEIKKKIFGKNAKKYIYSPCIKEKENDVWDSDSDSDKTYKKPDKCKIKFNMIQNGENRINTTKFIKNVDGKKIPIVVKSITEIANNIRFGSEIRLVFKYHKVWATKMKIPGSQYQMYGIGLTIIIIEFTPVIPQKILRMYRYIENCKFISDDEDSN